MAAAWSATFVPSVMSMSSFPAFTSDRNWFEELLHIYKKANIYYFTKCVMWFDEHEKSQFQIDFFHVFSLFIKKKAAIN